MIELNKKVIQFYDQVRIEIENIGDAIARGIDGSLYCESHEITHAKIDYHIWQYGCRGGSNEGWAVISVFFEDFEKPDVIEIVVRDFKAIQVLKKQYDEEHRKKQIERQELAELERLKKKYA